MASTDLQVKIIGPQRRREIIEPWSPGRSLADLAADILPPDGGYTAVVNGELIELDLWARYALAESAEVTFVPDFGFLAAFLTWALPTIFSAASMSSSVLGPLTWATVFNTIGWIGASYLINSLMPKPKIPDVDGSAMGGSAYSWDPRTTQQEGLVIPRTFGTFRAHGNIVSAYVAPSADGRELLIYALVAFCDGPVASVSNIYVNGQPAANYSGLTTETKRGTTNQTHVSFFDKTRLAYRYNRKVTVAGGAEDFQIPDDDYDDLELIFRLNCWHRYKNGKAGLVGADFTVYISVRDSGSWTWLFAASPSDASTEIKWLKYTISDYYEINRGTRYDIRVTKTGTDWDNDRRQNELWLETVQEVIDVSFKYPGMVLAGFSGIASEDLPGFLDVSAEIGPRVIDTYNGSAWSLASDSDCPAWVLWNIWTQPIITGDGDGEPYAIDQYQGFGSSRPDATDHYTLAAFCDTLVPDADGGTEKRVTFNGIFDRESSMWDAALTVCEVGRCLPVWNGNRITLAINQAKPRVGMISVGNILNGSFEESFAPTIDAAGEIEAEFCDAVRNYDRRTIPFVNNNITTAQNKVTLDLTGITKLTEIIRHIKHRLKQTELRQRTIVAKCDIDAMGYELGDRIGVQEDVPDWGELGTRGGGRLAGFTAGLHGYTDMSCVAHWKLNDNAWSTLVADSSGNGNVGTAQRNTVHTRVTGLIGGAFQGDGAADFVNCGTDSSLNWGSGDGSVCCWFKHGSAPASAEGFMLKGALGGGNKRYFLFVNSSGIPGFQIDDNTTAQTVYGAANMCNGAWHHLAGVRDGNNLRIYVDGSESTASPVDITGYGDIDDTEPLLLAAGDSGGGAGDSYVCAAAIDNAMVFSKALTAAEVTKLYNGGAGRENIDYDTLTLDHDVADYIAAGTTYEVALRLRDSRSPTLKTVLQVSGAAVDVQPHFTGTLPRAGDLWAMGKENLVLKDFTIEAIARAGNLQSTLTLLEYDADCFDTDDETPVIPISAAVIARADRRLTRPITRSDLRRQIPPAAMEFPTVDIPLTQNITWTSDDPSSGYASWSATTVGDPLLLTYDGTANEITAGNTDKKYIYWDAAAPTVFGTTDTLATALGSGKWLMAYNESGTVYPAFGRKIIHGGLIQAATITAALGQIADLTVGTLQIQDDAVTVMSAAESSGSDYLDPSPVGSGGYGLHRVAVSSPAITATGAPILTSFDCAIDGHLLTAATLQYVELFRSNDANTKHTVYAVTLTGTNPVVITTTNPHGLSTDDYVWMWGLGGTTELNNAICKITVIDPNAFSLQDTRSDWFTAWTSGGYVWFTSYWNVNYVTCPSASYAIGHVETIDAAPDVGTQYEYAGACRNRHATLYSYVLDRAVITATEVKK